MESNLVYLYILTNPKTSTEKIYSLWQRSKILREYERPEKEILNAWVTEIKKELINKGIKLRLN